MFRADYGARLEGRRAILYPTFTDDYLEFFVAIDGTDLWLMHHFLQPAETAADFPPDRLQSIVVKASGLPSVPVEILSVMPWVMSPKVARRYRIGRIFLVGDAAARLSPTGGLGLNTGLQSAHNLAWKLAAVVKGEAGSSLLDTYQEERRDAAFWTMQNTNRNADEITDISASTGRHFMCRATNTVRLMWSRFCGQVSKKRFVPKGPSDGSLAVYNSDRALGDGSFL